MNKKEWLNLIKEKEEEIKEKLEEAFKKAANYYITDFKLEHTVILDNDGEVRIMTSTSNTTDGRVWKGDAIEIAGITDFDIYEHEHYFDILSSYMTEEEMEKYEEWYKENYIIEYSDEVLKELGVTRGQVLDSIEYTLTDLKEFDKDIYNRVNNEYLEDYIDNYIFDWVEDKYNRIIVDYEEYIKYEEECQI